MATVTYEKIANIRGPKGDPGTFESVTVESIAADEAPFALISGDRGEHLHIGVARGIPGVNALENDAAVAAYIGAVASEVDRSLRARYPITTSPEKYGAKGDGIEDDTTAVEQALAERSAFGKVEVRIDKQYRVTRELQWDVAQVVLSGRGGVLVCDINDASKWLLTTYSSDPGDIASPIRQAALGMFGVILWGDQKTNGLNITGASGSDKPAHVGFDRSVITRFGTAVRFGRNAYMNRFNRSNITLSRIGLLYDGAQNAGERLSFIDCDITGHGTAIVSSGQAMHFTVCSFSYNLGRIARLSGGAQVYMLSPHIEMNAPYKSWFRLSGNGTTVNLSEPRILVRDQVMTTTASTFTNGSVDVVWSDNPRDRFEVGDPFRFGGVVGPGNVDNNTTYYFTQVSSTGFRFAASDGGTNIVPSASGTATGILPVQGAAMVNVSSDTNMFVIRGGHVSGSADPVRTQTLATGPGGFKINDSAGFDQSTLRFRNRENGDLFDGTFTNASIVDEWECDAIGTLEVDTSINALRFTKQTAGAGDIRLWVPIDDAASFLMEFRHRSSTAVAVAHSAFWRPRRVLSGRSALYTSTLNAGAAVDGDYVQAGFTARHAPSGARFILFTWTMTNLAVGDTFRLQLVRPSLS